MLELYAVFLYIDSSINLHSTTMTWQSEFWSWMSPSAVKVGTTPSIGEKAPSTGKLSVPMSDGKPVVVSFLRHCGCPCTHIYHGNTVARLIYP